MHDTGTCVWAYKHCTKAIDSDDKDVMILLLGEINTQYACESMQVAASQCIHILRLYLHINLWGMHALAETS